MEGIDLAERYLATRTETERLAAPLSAEDQLVQPTPDASPTKWHRAHTTWFFETFVLAPRGVPPHDPRFGYLWNSYYEAIGPRHPRPKRGLLSRPSLAEVTAYRQAVDGRVVELLSSLDPAGAAALAPIIELGIAHEEQHQELILTDILAVFSENPLEPVYAPLPAPAGHPAPEGLSFIDHEGGLITLGHGGGGFAFDNEGPRHRVFVEPFSLATRPVLVADVLAFAREGGYRTPALWLSEGWAWARASGVEAPGYARIEGDQLRYFTLHGPRVAAPGEPASHLSYYEADAITRFLGGRLPTEVEWELAAVISPSRGQFREDGALVPVGQAEGNPGSLGGIWEWTASAYSAYPGYAPGPGALGEYNGKFMIGQQVLRGGSCLTNRAHVRPTYRNFWPPATRFQMTGARVALDRNRNARAS
jgi:ergothioneine biosynthesis protein EgtB